MKTSKEQLIEFEENYLWFGLRYPKIEIPFRDKTYVFDHRGFSVIIEAGIRMSLNEMNQDELGHCWYLIPMFLGKINEVV